LAIIQNEALRLAFIYIASLKNTLVRFSELTHDLSLFFCPEADIRIDVGTSRVLKTLRSPRAELGTHVPISFLPELRP
jgi:hypothetical protein